jgi:HEXXH motif-containing protein
MNGAKTDRFHSLSVDQFEALAQGGGDQAAIEQLVAAEQSKHLILLAQVAELARHGDHPDDRIAMAGSELLALVQRQDMLAAAEVISYPSVGAWALHVIRADGAPPGGAGPSGLAAVAAAAAVRAGLDIEIEVPVVNGAVLLPSLGAADAAGDTAFVAAKAAEVRSGSGCVEMRAGAPGWHGLRQVALGSRDVLVDDLDPFRMSAGDGVLTGRLSPQALEELRAMLGMAWPVLPPASAAETAAIVRVIVPAQSPASGYFSTSSPLTFGTVAMSRQPDEYTCAETLVHETQHLKLCALLDLVPLMRPDNGERYYAPWRTDPRPAGSLLQGAYAFLGVSGFWRDQRQVAPDQEVRLRAQAKFARWREGAAGAVGTLLDSGQLTGPGQVFAENMARVLDDWRREPVPDEAVARARRESEHHLAQWHADNG